MLPINGIDELVTVMKAAREELPEPPSPQTLHRWRAKGLKGVRLKTMKIGRKRYTTIAAFRQFLSDVAAAEEGHAESPSERSAAVQKKLQSKGLVD